MFVQNRTGHSNVPFKRGQVMAGLRAPNILSCRLEAPLVKSPTTQFKEQLSSFLRL